MNEIIGKTKDKGTVVNSLRSENMTLTKGKEIVNEFGKHFSRIGKTYAEKIATPDKYIALYLELIHRNQQSAYMTPTYETEIAKLIEKLPNKRSSSHDNIDNIMLKRLKEVLVEPLTLVFDASIKNGIFPMNMKTAEVVPLHKGGNREEKNNYRPISLLLTISKLLEKVVYKRVYTFLDSTNQLYNSQYGFSAKHSCSQAISELVGEVVKNTERNLTTCSIFIDLSKAFDTLEHSTVIKKLERYGIRGQTLLWFKSYLECRKLHIRCTTDQQGKTDISDTYDIEYGTPQGSCIGPLIFLIFCNDISLSLQHMQCIQFADDTTLYLGHKNSNYLQYCINYDLRILQDWF